MNKDWLDIAVLEDYLGGKLDAKTMNRVEREALEDPFVAEALEGLSTSPKRSLQSISLLQRQLQDRIAEQNSIKKTSVITWQRLSIAATAAVMFISVSIVFWMKENTRQKELAALPKKVEVTIAAKSGTDVPAAASDEPLVVAAAPVADSKADITIDKAIREARNKKNNRYAAIAKTEKTEAFRSDHMAESLKEVTIAANNIKAKRNVMASASVVVTSPTNELSGRVTAKDDGTPIAGAIVKIEGTQIQSVTDIDGNFSMRTDTTVKSAKIKANMIGFNSAELLAMANKPVGISLNPNNSALNEVVVMGAVAAKKQDTQFRIRGVSTSPKMDSEPIGGWNKLFEYIHTNNSFNAETKIGAVVELSFKIDKEGKPAQIEILKGAAAKYEDEAIRLILNGPKWEQPKKANSRIKFSIDF